MPVPEMITLRQAPPKVESNFYQKEIPQIAKKEVVEIIHIHELPKINWQKTLPTVFKCSFFGSIFIPSLIYKEVATALVVSVVVSAMVLLTIYAVLFIEIKESKNYKPKIKNYQILEQIPPASQPPPAEAKPPQKPDDKVSLAELQENAKNSGNTKLANQIKNLENISKSLSDQINLKINFTK